MNDLQISDILSKEDIRALRTPSNTRAMSILVTNWLLIALAFSLFIVWSNPLTFIAGTILLGGRQLGLGVILHDCSHNSFLSSLKLNNMVGHYLCGAPMNISVHDYRSYHMKHHRYAGTDKDPDIIFVDKYPVPQDSLKRKLIRDITGRTGVRDTLLKLKNFELAKSYPWLIFHALLITLLFSIGVPLAYLMWWAAELTVYPLVVRLRQIGEHGVATDRSDLDPRMNTGTTLPSWWERLLIAPNHVYYHVEHHQYANIPPYNLHKLHTLLVERCYYDDYDCVANGFADVLRRAVQPRDAHA